MRDRSFGVTALAFSAVMVALYGQFAGIALLLTGLVSIGRRFVAHSVSSR